MEKSGSALLRAWMARGGYTKQGEIAAMFGCSEPFLSMLLNGDRAPGRALSVKIEALTGIPVRSWGLTDDNEAEQLVAAEADKRGGNKA